jgi:hypothetical protein
LTEAVAALLAVAVGAANVDRADDGVDDLHAVATEVGLVVATAVHRRHQ